ncbi:hypothetical protein FHX15_000576 [Rhizobium sp. BK650]|uniref:DUF6886 family protein n=1 Tax=Rhizobium sp. BK650 TaxID=2586990 RepID=UPI001608E791|nr:DUF6886 family protein [Rhizobium sp. BK650]MBB3655377.1 hypothetical protein [Rhizobium sp. BK650]
MRLFHFSDDPTITIFEPRPVCIASERPPGREWLNGPLVWAIDDVNDFMYLFPRDCPRILIWAKPETSEEDRQLLGGWRGAAYIERGWLERLQAGRIHRYEMPTESFEDLQDAGMWVSRKAVVPLALSVVSRLDFEFAPRGIELRVVESLMPLKALRETTLHVSAIRLRNAQP